MTSSSAPAICRTLKAARPRLPWVALLALACLGVAALALLDRALAISRDALGQLAFGRPLGWLLQDHSAMDPRNFPRRQTVASPWEHPTGVDVLPLLLDVMLVLLLLAVLWRTTTWLAGRRAGLCE